MSLSRDMLFQPEKPDWQKTDCEKKQNIVQRKLYCQETKDAPMQFLNALHWQTQSHNLAPVLNYLCQITPWFLIQTTDRGGVTGV